ncbi:MAG: hypothetical protein IT258_06145 [Saprospiraceae bacterium]|nr:hypothetical protein [Saprospiraceae bacterium]
MNGTWSKISLLFLLVIALVGTLMRLSPFLHLPLAYDHLLHAHSHTAFQGWVYTAMMLLLANLFLSKEQIQSGKYAPQFKLTVVVIVGVLVSFAMQGYGLYSIVFSTMFQLLNYCFIFRFFKDARQLPASISLRWVKAGLRLGLLSSLAPFAIGALSAKGMGGSEAYQSAVYFFLHFQYNGWFQFVALGLFFKWLEMDGVNFDAKKAKRFYALFTIAVIPAYLLSLLGMSFGQVVWVPAAMAALLQILGLWAFYRTIDGSTKSWFSTKNKWVQAFLWFAAGSLFLKYILQFLSVFPPIQAVAFSNRNLIIGYLHLCLLGVITCFFIALFFELKWLELRKATKIGSALFLIGFLATEALLGASGMGWGSALMPLLLFSGLMAVGIPCFLTRANMR